MYKSLFLILLVFFVQTAHATIDWSWSFEPSSIEVGVYDSVPLDFSITNNFSSDTAISPASFDLSDGSWGSPRGLIVNAAGELLYAPTFFAVSRNAVIAPGETQSFRGAWLHPWLYPNPSNLFPGQIININPLFYISDTPGGGIRLPAFPGKLSTNSLQIKIAEITIPSTLWLCVFGLLYAMVTLRRVKKF